MRSEVAVTAVIGSPSRPPGSIRRWSCIPHLYLLDPDGRIVKQGMRGEETDALLKMIFK